MKMCHLITHVEGISVTVGILVLFCYVGTVFQVVDSGETYSLLKSNIVVPRSDCLSPIPPISPTHSSMAQACMRMEISSSSSTLRANADMLEYDTILEETTHHSTPVKSSHENFVDTLTTISESCSQESLCSTGIPCRKIPKLTGVDEPDFVNSFDISADPAGVRSSLPANFVAPQLMEIEPDSGSNQGSDTNELQSVTLESNIPPPASNSAPAKKSSKNFFKAPLTRRLSFAFSRSSFSRKSDASSTMTGISINSSNNCRVATALW